MKNKSERTLSRREFARRAAMLSATASLIPTKVIRPQAPPAAAPPQTAPSQPKLTDAGQAEAESRYQQILSLYSDHLDEAQKANIKRMCDELQPSLERIRKFPLQNGDAPALYLKPLVERDRKPLPAPATSKPGASPAKQ
jgi:acyl transferase domain-containing protein